MKAQKMDLDYFIQALWKNEASDLHLKTGRPPLYRVNGKLSASKMPPMTRDQIEEMVALLLTKEQILDLGQKKQIDLPLVIPNLGRCRCNVFHQKGEIALVIRRISNQAPSIESLGLPRIVGDLCNHDRGLILITGSTGSGKSTTLAAMIEKINREREVHVLTIEDPIEVIFEDKVATVTQREIGTDAVNFHQALVSGLRQDPDVIMVGELRDFESIKMALTAAETGHLVFSTLHTNDAKGTIDRFVGMFPSAEQNQVRMQLASSLLAVISQHLLTRKDAKGRVLASEVLINTSTIQSLILANDLNRIPQIMEESQQYHSMQTLNQELERLVKADLISEEEALSVSRQPENLRLALSGISKEVGYETKK